MTSSKTKLKWTAIVIYFHGDKLYALRMSHDYEFEEILSSNQQTWIVNRCLTRSLLKFPGIYLLARIPSLSWCELFFSVPVLGYLA